MGHGATYQRIGEDLVLGVEHGDAVVEDGRVLNLEAWGGLDGRDLIRGQVAGEVVLAGKQPVDARGDLRNLDEADFLEGRAATPVFIEGDEGERNVRPIVAYHVGAGGDRLARPVGIGGGFIPGAAVGDLAAAGIEASFQRYVGRRVMETHGVLVDGFYAGKRRPQAATDARNGRRQFLDGGRLVVGFEDRLAALRLCITEHALLGEGEDHVFGGQLVAIVELDALAQPQLERLVVDALPLGCEARNRALVTHPVTLDQAFPEVREEDAFADVRLLVPNVERVVVGDLLHGNRHRRALALGEAHAGQDQAASGRADQSKRAASIDGKHRNPPFGVVSLEQRPSSCASRVSVCSWAHVFCMTGPVAASAAGIA